jgi:hypothetical protein
MSANGRRVMAILVGRPARRRTSRYLGIAGIGGAVVHNQPGARRYRPSAFTLTTLCDNAHLVKHTAGFIGYAYLPFGFVRQIGDDIPGQISAHYQSCVFSRRCVGQDVVRSGGGSLPLRTPNEYLCIRLPRRRLRATLSKQKPSGDQNCSHSSNSSRIPSTPRYAR